MIKFFKLLIIIKLILLQSCAYMLNKKEVNLVLDSYPQGADIIIEGKNYGKTPKVITIEPKNYNVLFKLPNYGSANLKLETWQAIREKKGDGGRCLADALGTMLILPMFSYWSVYCRDFKKNKYLINIPQNDASRSVANGYLPYNFSQNSSYYSHESYNQRNYQQRNNYYNGGW